MLRLVRVWQQCKKRQHWCDASGVGLLVATVFSQGPSEIDSLLGFRNGPTQNLPSLNSVLIAALALTSGTAQRNDPERSPWQLPTELPCQMCGSTGHDLIHCPTPREKFTAQKPLRRGITLLGCLATASVDLSSADVAQSLHDLHARSASREARVAEALAVLQGLSTICEDGPTVLAAAGEQWCTASAQEVLPGSRPSDASPRCSGSPQ